MVPGGSVNLSGNVERPVTITGRSDKPLQSVMINQQAAKITEGGLGFVFNKFYLREGNNMLSAVGTDAQGRNTSTSILVNVDQTAPLLSIESPQDQTLISRSKIDIRGTVNDAVEGLFQAPQPTLSVQVNGKTIEAATQVTDKQFLIKDLPLQTGPNRIVITASDMHGNQRSASILVLRNFIGSSRITLLSGDQQSGPIGEKLAQPLKIVALDENGSPLAKQAINVDVIRGSGSISDSASQEHKANGLTLSRNLKLMTDNNGELQVWHRLGTQAGPGANAIRFSHPSIPEEAIFTATSQPGPVAILNGDMGLFQNVQTQSQPLELLTAVVRDKALNPLSGVAVEFFVKTGQAYFAPEEGVMIADMNGKTGQKITLKTDKNGLVAVRPYIGEEEGLVEIQAKLATIATIGGSTNNASNATNTASPVLADVIFKLQAKAAKDGPTGFSGRVFDDKGLPIAGVTLSIARTLNSTTTDAKGQFNFSDIPAGRIDLFVDGRTVNPNLDSGKPQYPSLHFEAYAVQGQANSLTHPIYMPPLLITPQSAKLVGAQDTTLTLPNLAGFSMFIKKGSVTFPDGSKTGQLIVSPVTADRLPMSPPSGGALFGLPAWTIQPAGTRFDPPIEVRMPNNTALPPGSRTPVIQWDHDLGQYTAMGYATVSEDGSQLITEAGSGISKAGWGGAVVFSPGGTASGGGDGPPPPPCGKPIPPPPRKISAVKIEVDNWEQTKDPVELINKPLTFRGTATAEGCSPKYKWTMGDGTEKQGQTITHAYKNPLKASVNLTVVCEAVPATSCTPSIAEVAAQTPRTIYAAKVTFLEAWSDQLPGVKVNGHPDKMGNTNTPYVLMGARSDGLGYIQVKSKIEPNMPKDALKNFKYLISIADGYDRKTEDVREVVNNDYTQLMPKVYYKLTSVIDYKLEIFIDANDNNSLDGVPEESSVSPPAGKVSSPGWPFKIVTQQAYDQALNDWNGMMATFGPLNPAAHEIVMQFLGGGAGYGVLPTSPQPVWAANERGGPETVSELAHPIGIANWSGQLAFVPTSDYKKESKLNQKVLASNAMENLIDKVLKREHGTLNKLIKTGETQAKFDGVVMLDKQDLVFDVSADTDLFLGLHNTRGSLKLSGTIRKGIYYYFYENLSITGEMTDIFDFRITQWYLQPFNNTKGAYLQAGYPTLGNAGKVVGQLLKFNQSRVPGTFAIKYGL